MKLVSVPDMGYHAKDLKGEIWLRGNGVFKGYFKDPEKTAETITADGWLKTGDIGVLDNYGRLYIVDRKKNLFKLAQGEYIAPEKLEISFSRSPFIAQIFVHGDSLKSELVAIVVPDMEYSIVYAKKNGLLPPDTVEPAAVLPGAPPHPLLVSLCENSVFKNALAKAIQEIAVSEKMRGFEFIKAFHLEPQQFSAESGLLTPTFKLKRAEAAKYYRPVIDSLYKELDKKPQGSKL
jgi:long-chain acyl-CoA synthetase